MLVVQEAIDRLWEERKKEKKISSFETTFGFVSPYPKKVLQVLKQIIGPPPPPPRSKTPTPKCVVAAVYLQR